MEVDQFWLIKTISSMLEDITKIIIVWNRQYSLKCLTQPLHPLTKKTWFNRGVHLELLVIKRTKKSMFLEDMEILVFWTTVRNIHLIWINGRSWDKWLRRNLMYQLALLTINLFMPWVDLLKVGKLKMILRSSRLSSILGRLFKLQEINKCQICI